jgi:hypothetical protein
MVALRLVFMQAPAVVGVIEFERSIMMPRKPECRLNKGGRPEQVCRKIAICGIIQTAADYPDFELL